MSSDESKLCSLIRKRVEILFVFSSLSPKGVECLHGGTVCVLCVSENAAALEELLLEYESKQLAASKGSSIK